MSTPLQSIGKDCFLSVRATPTASRNEIAGLRHGEVLVRVTAAPDKGKANAAIMALLAEATGLPMSNFELISGETTRNKRFRLASGVAAVQTWLNTLEE